AREQDRAHALEVEERQLVGDAATARKRRAQLALVGDGGAFELGGAARAQLGDACGPFAPHALLRRPPLVKTPAIGAHPGAAKRQHGSDDHDRKNTSREHHTSDSRRRARTWRCSWKAYAARRCQRALTASCRGAAMPRRDRRGSA